MSDPIGVFQSYLRSQQSGTPLGVSSRQNTTSQTRKQVESVAVDVLRHHSSSPQTSLLAAKALFSMEYALLKPLDLIRLHQGHIIAVIEAKNYQNALAHLRLLQQFIHHLGGNSGVPDIGDGIPYMDEFSEWAKLVVAWYFLLVQTILNYVVAHAKFVAGEADGEVSPATLMTVAKWFLPSAPFSRWILAVPEAAAKYAANKLKLTKGMIQVCTKLLATIPDGSKSLRLARSGWCLIYLILEPSDHLEVKQMLLVTPELMPFVAESSAAVASEIKEMGEPSSVSDICQAMASFRNHPSVEAATAVLYSLADPPLNWIYHNDVIGEIRLIKWTNDPSLMAMAKVVLKAIGSAQPTKEVIKVVDAITIWIKQSLPAHCRLFVEIMAAMAPLVLLSPYYRRLRNFSNLTFHHYQINKLKECLIAALDWDRLVYEKSGTDADWQFLQSRASQVIQLSSDDDIKRYCVDLIHHTNPMGVNGVIQAFKTGGEKTIPQLISELSGDYNHQHFEQLLSLAKTASDDEKVLVSQYLRSQALYGRVVDLMTSVSTISSLFELCEAYLHLRIVSNATQVMATLGNLLKTNQIAEFATIIRYNCLQIHLMILDGDIGGAESKYNKISRIVEARTPVDGDMASRYQYLLIVAELNYWGSQIQYLGNHYLAGYRGAKLAIKYLYTIVKANNPAAVSRHHQWHTTTLLVKLLQLVMSILKHLGITRDLLYYKKELLKVCDAHSAPVVKVVVTVDLMGYCCLLGDSREYARLNDGVVLLLGVPVVQHDVISRYLVSEIGHLAQGQPVAALAPPRLDDITSYSTMDLPTSEWSYLLLLNNHAYHGDDTTSRLFSVKTDLEQTVATLVGFPEYTSLVESALALPGVGEIGAMPRIDADTVANLVACKNTLLSLVEDADIVATFKHKEVSRIINQCLLALAAILALKQDSGLLADMYYIQEQTMLLPFKNDHHLDHGVTKTTGLAPVPIVARNVSEFGSLAVKFTIDLNMYLPATWLVVTIDVCDTTGSLIVLKFTKGRDPFFVRLSMARRPGMVGFDATMDEFKRIIDESNNLTKLLTTSKITTKDQRKQWWELRYQLDLRLKHVLTQAGDWFGGFGGLFTHHVHDKVFHQFRHELGGLFTRHNMPMALDNVFQLFYGLEDLMPAYVDDLITFVHQQFVFHGHEVNISPVFRAGVMKLLDKFRPLKTTVSDSHIVIVPLARVHSFCWESIPWLRSQSVTRVPAVLLIIDTLKRYKQLTLTLEKCLYLINPGGDLKRTEESFASKFDRRGWHGVVGRPPKIDELVPEMFNNDLFVYLGHGSSDRYLPTLELYRQCLIDGHTPPPSLLIGCSLGAVSDNGLLEPHGNIFNWLTCRAPMVLANLWDVTDKDIDQFSQAVFEKWGLMGSAPTMNIAKAVAASRGQCNLMYLNGCAPVVYGVPFSLVNQE